MLNEVTLIGRLKAKPELRKTNETGKSVCSFTLAVQRDVSRQAENNTVDWINCVAWGSNAEHITQYFDKGKNIVVTGRLTSRVWEDIHKQVRKVNEVVVDHWYYVPRDKAASQDGIDIEVDDEPTGAAPSRPRSNRQARFTELADDVDLPF